MFGFHAAELLSIQETSLPEIDLLDYFYLCCVCVLLLLYYCIVGVYVLWGSV